MGNEDAMLFLAATYLSGDVLTIYDAKNKSIEWMTRCANRRNRRALAMLAQWYLQGPFAPPNLDYDFSKAFRCMKKATEVCSTMVYNENNRIQYFGTTPVSELEESNWYCTLGAMYMNGLGGPKDELEAFKNYQQAALRVNQNQKLPHH